MGQYGVANPWGARPADPGQAEAGRATVLGQRPHGHVTAPGHDLQRSPGTAPAAGPDSRVLSLIEAAVSRLRARPSARA
jgi:hypothetical protein